jgi:hypothetical protein
MTKNINMIRFNIKNVGRDQAAYILIYIYILKMSVETYSNVAG